jgi:hypothetical protein
VGGRGGAANIFREGLFVFLFAFFLASEKSPSVVAKRKHGAKKNSDI